MKRNTLLLVKKSKWLQYHPDYRTLKGLPKFNEYGNIDKTIAKYKQ